MATQRIDPSVSIQPTPAPEDPRAAAQGAVARQMASGFTATEQAGQMVGQIATNYLREQALEQAQRDAAGIVEYDKDNNLLIPKNFDAPVGGGLLYSEAYSKAAEASYKLAATREVERKAQELQSQFPTNPEAISAKLLEYTKAKVDAMPASVRPILAAQFESIRAQAATSAAAARQKQANETLARDANDSLDRFVTNWSSVSAAEARGNYDPEAIKQRKALLEEDWNSYRALAIQSGRTEPEIQRDRQLAETQAKARNFFERIGQQVGQSGESAQIVMAGFQEEITKFEREHPGVDAQRVIAHEKQRALADASARASATVVGQNIQQDNFTAEERRLQVERSEAIKRITTTPGIDQTEELKKFNADWQKKWADLNSRRERSNMRPIQKATLALSSMNAQDEGTYRMMATAVANENAVIYDVKSTQDQRSLALKNLDSLLTSPEFIQYSLSSTHGASLYRQVQAQVGEAHGVAMTRDVAAYQQGWATGRVSIEDEDRILKEGQDRNFVGNTFSWQIRPQQMQKLVETNSAIRAEEAETRRLLRGAEQAVKIGGTPNEAQVAAITKHAPLKTFERDPVTGDLRRVAPDFNNPVHAQDAVAYVARWGVIPPEARDYMKSALGEADPKKRENMLALGRAMQGTLDNIYSRVGPTGAPLEPKERDELVAAKMIAGLDKGYDAYMALSALGPQATPSELQRYIESEKHTRANPDKQSETIERVRKHLSGAWAASSEGIVDSIGSWFKKNTLDPKGAAGAWFGESALTKWDFMKNEASRKALAPIIANSGIQGYLNEVPLYLSEEVVLRMGAYTHSYKDVRGDADVKQGLDPDRQGMLSYLLKAGDTHAITEMRDSNGKLVGRQLEIRPFFLEANKVHGAGLNQRQWTDLIAAKVMADNPTMFGSDGIDPRTIRISTVLRRDGTPIHGAYGYNPNTQMTQYLGDVDPRDPKLGLMRGQIFEAVARELNDDPVAYVLSNLPIFGNLIGQKLQEDLKSTFLREEAGRVPHEQWGRMLHTIRTGLREGPMAEFVKPEYDEAWKRAGTKEALRAINRAGGVPYLMGWSPQKIFPNLVEEPVDNAPDMSWQSNASPDQQRGMEETAQALGQRAAVNRGSRKADKPIDRTSPPDADVDPSLRRTLTPAQKKRLEDDANALRDLRGNPQGTSR